MMRRAYPTRRSTARRAFTLAELLAVIVIMSLLMVVVIPGISGMTRGASLRGATMQVRTTLIAARQTAITRRTDVSVLFPTAITGNDPKNFRAIAIYTNGGTTASSGFVSTWEFLPPGIVFKRLTGTSPSNIAVMDGGVSYSVDSVTFNRLGEYTTTGNIQAQFWLLEGFVNGGTILKKTLGATNQVNILCPTGIIQVKRL